MIKKYIEAGKVVGTHGVKGEMRFEPWCDSPSFLIKFKRLYSDADGTGFLSVSVRPHGNICLIKADGIESIEAAEKLRNKVLFIDRDDCQLKKGSYFITDIIGLSVFDAENGTEYGVIKDVSSTGANDVWHIEKDGREYLMPNIPQFVKEVDIENGKVTVTPIKGIFDDED